MTGATGDYDGRDGVQSVRELMREDLPPMRWFLPGIIPLRGVTLFFASEKSGKSALVLSAIISAAHGDRVLGHWQPDGEIGTLYLDLETPKAAATERVGVLCAGRAFPHRLDIVCADSALAGGVLGWPRMHDGGLEKLDRYLAHHRTDLVVVDTWGLFKSSRHVGAQYSYDRDVAEVQELKVLAARHNAGVFLIHHEKKGRGDDWVQRASGTTGLTGSCDTLVNLERIRGGVTALLRVTGRYVRTSRHRLAFNDTTLAFTYLHDADTSAVSEARVEIVALLHMLEEPMSPSELAITLNKRPGTVRMLLANMLKAGEVLVTDDRRYTVPLEE